MKGPLSTVGRSNELKKAKEKSIKFNPMGKTAQKKAAIQSFPIKEVNLQAAVDTVSDTKQPMKKQRLEDASVGKKIKYIRKHRRLAKGGRAGYDTGKIVRDTDTSKKPRPPQVPLNQRPEWKRRHFLDKTQLELGKKRIRNGKEIKNSRTQPDLKKRKKAMEKFQLGKKYNIGGRANLLEEMGRLDAEKMNPNRRAEKHRVIGELNRGYKSGGAVLKGKKVGCQIK